MTRETYNNYISNNDVYSLLFEFYSENNKEEDKKFSRQDFNQFFQFWTLSLGGMFGTNQVINKCLDNIKEKLK